MRSSRTHREWKRERGDVSWLGEVSSNCVLDERERGKEREQRTNSRGVNSRKTSDGGWTFAGGGNASAVPAVDEAALAGGGTGEEEEEKGGEDEVGGEERGVPHWVTCLEEELNEQLLVVLRDGKKYIGFLRTFDQFGNLVLENTVRRLIVGKDYCDLYLGCLLIRGENVVLFGAVDQSKPTPLQQRPLHEILAAQQLQEEEEQRTRLSSSSWGDRQLSAAGDGDHGW